MQSIIKEGTSSPESEFPSLRINNHAVTFVKSDKKEKERKESEIVPWSAIIGSFRNVRNMSLESNIIIMTIIRP